MPSVSKSQQKTCKGCGNPPKTEKGWCSVDCYRKNQSKSGTNVGWFKRGVPSVNKIYDTVISNCKTCDVKFSHDGKGKYCSLACFYRDRQTIPITKCSNCKKSIRKKVGTSGHIYCNKQCYNEYRKFHKVSRVDSRSKPNIIKICEQCGDTYSVYWQLENSSRFCSLSCSGTYAKLIQSSYTTSIERSVANVLTEMNINYNAQFPIKLGKYHTIADFYIKNNIVIYCDGDYWHNIPKTRSRDAYINKALNSMGYDIIRFSENNILNDIEGVKSTLECIV